MTIIVTGATVTGN